MHDLLREFSEPPKELLALGVDIESVVTHGISDLSVAAGCL